MSPDEVNEAMERAREACLLLDEQGQKVTARGVQALAGVRMAVAARAAREFNEAEAELEAGDPVPASVVGVAEMLWVRALKEAEERGEPERIGLRVQVEDAQAQVAELKLQVRKLEAIQTELIEEWQLVNATSTTFVSELHKALREIAELKGEEIDEERLWVATPQELAAKRAELPDVMTYSQEPGYLEQFEKDMEGAVSE